MGARLEPQPPPSYRGRLVSELGLRLRHKREQIEAAARRGETKLLNKQELLKELETLRKRDSDLP